MSLFAEAFVRTTPFGVLAGIQVPAEPDAPVPEELHAGERAHAATLPPRRRTEWVSGRIAFWRAAAELGRSRGALLVGPRGEPVLPAGLSGSISHKRTLAVALVAAGDGEERSVGIDLEALAPPRPAIEEIALRPDEREALRRLPEPERWPSLLLAFALKEALYKALHPRLNRYVRYAEAAIDVSAAGTPRITLHLDGDARFETEVHVEAVDGHVLACVRVTPR